MTTEPVESTDDDEQSPDGISLVPVGGDTAPRPLGSLQFSLAGMFLAVGVIGLYFQMERLTHGLYAVTALVTATVVVPISLLLIWFVRELRDAGFLRTFGLLLGAAGSIWCLLAAWHWLFG